MNAPALERPRPLSLDVFQGIAILAFLLVTGLAGVHGLPPWLRHGAPFQAGIAPADLVVPLLAFGLGMSLPFSPEFLNRSWRRMLTRASALLLLGFLEVNGQRMVAGPWMVPEIWRLLEVAALLLAWDPGWTHPFPRLAGWGLLGLCLFLYPRGNTGGVLVMRPAWWGVAGLLGWSYLMACLVVLPGRGRTWVLPAGLVAFLALASALGNGLLARVPSLEVPENPLFTCPPLAAILLAGALLGRFLGGEGSRRDRAGWMATYGAVLLLASHLVHPREPMADILTIGRELGTLTWCLRAAAFGAFLALALFLLVAWSPWHPGASFLGEVGRNALVAYLLAPALLGLAALLARSAGHPEFPDALGQTLGGGLLRASGLALAACGLAGFLGVRGLHPGE